MDHSGWTFFCGCAPFSYFAFFAREKDKLADQDIVATTFYRWNERSIDPSQQWSIYSIVVNWRAQAMASVKESSGERVVVCVGRQGQFYELYPGLPKQFEGVIDSEEIYPRSVTVLDHAFYLAGLGRIVKRRVDRGQWVEFGPGSQGEGKQEIMGIRSDWRTFGRLDLCRWLARRDMAVERAHLETDGRTDQRQFQCPRMRPRRHGLCRRR